VRERGGILSALRCGAQQQPEDDALCDLARAVSGIELAPCSAVGRRLFGHLYRLRQWHDTPSERRRYEGVADFLAAAFPHLCEEIVFDAALGVDGLGVRRPGASKATPIEYESSGLRRFLEVLCRIAAAEHGGLVAIDEPERSLHPWAIRRLMEYTRQQARREDLTVIFATHSPVLLSEFDRERECVWVLGSKRRLGGGTEGADGADGADGTTDPVPLTRMYNQEWLAHFSTGDLYAQYDFSSPVEET